MSEAPAVVLLHGFTNSGASWQPVISGLGQRYRAFAPDIRGHASASETTPVTLEAVLEDLARFDEPRFMPRRIERLVLIGASPGLEDEAERADRRAADERLAEQIETLSIEEFATIWAQTPVLGGLDAETAAAAHADRVRSTPHGLAAALRGLGTGALPSLWERLRGLSVPVTLICGGRDAKFTGLASQMAALIPRAEVVIVPGAGHAVHLERPDAVVAELQRVVPADEPVTEP
jgi:pimeloyl-ACP methyl ester carboxylesterase